MTALSPQITVPSLQPHWMSTDAKILGFKARQISERRDYTRWKNLTESRTSVGFSRARESCYVCRENTQHWPMRKNLVFCKAVRFLSVAQVLAGNHLLRPAPQLVSREQSWLLRQSVVTLVLRIEISSGFEDYKLRTPPTLLLAICRRVVLPPPQLCDTFLLAGEWFQLC